MNLRTQRILGVLVCLFFVALPASAQSTGTVETGLLLRQLDGVKRVLMIAAHPDDEDTSLLAELAKGWGAETAYLSLTRGEGGQNLIGPELREGLGIVRTGELLGARRLDGGRQFFTRAFDFGYSKSADEALRLWPEDELLRDVVWIVRSFRPHVIVSVFSGTPSDGHGQHQAAGIMAHRVYDAAADPGLYPEQFDQGLRPWQVQKLYRASWFNPDAATATLETGYFDPLLGRSHYQVAMDSRSQHRSQEMGSAQGLGPRQSAVVLVRAENAPDIGDGKAALEALEEGGFFAGVDTTIVSLAEWVESGDATAVRAALERYRTHIDEARGAFDPYAPWGVVEALAGARSALEGARNASGPSDWEVTQTLHERAVLLSRAIASSSGVVADVRTNDDLVVPGEPFRVDVEVWNGGPDALADVEMALRLPDGAEVVPTEPPAPRRRFFDRGAPAPVGPPEGSVWQSPEPFGADVVEAGGIQQWSFWVRLDPATPPSRLYYLENERPGEMYEWPEDPTNWGLPRTPDPLSATLSFAKGDARADVAVPVRYRRVEPAGGEFSEPVLIIPAVSVSVDPRAMVWPAGSSEPQTLAVNVTSGARDGANGTVELQLPTGFRAEPEQIEFSLGGAGATETVRFTLLSDGQPRVGRHSVEVMARVDGQAYREGLDLIDYEHIPRTPLFHVSRTDIEVFPVRIASGLSIGYVMGSGDQGPAAIRRLGIDPVLLDEAALATGDLSGFDVIVVGVRAYEVRADLRTHNGRLLDWARGGGTLIVQYNQYEYPRGDYAPYPVSISRPHDRITDETATVNLLDPSHPLFAGPNQIGPEDFEGWIQERSLYQLGTWDERYTPLIEMTDPGDDPTRGSLLVAPLDQGLYVYTGLALFRQLPAGVPGAFRLFANLLSLRAPGVS